MPLDRAECAHCAMIVSDLAHAAQAVAPNEEPRFYDDRGCLARDAARLTAGARLYVQLDGAAGWIDVNEAFFAFPARLQTPMASGMTAFRSPEQAAQADRTGRARRWSDVVGERDTHD